MLATLRVPADNTRGPLFMEQALSGIHQGNPRRLPMSFGMTTRADDVTLFGRFPPGARAAVENQVYAQFPDAMIVPLAEETERTDASTWTTFVTLQPYLFPIKRYVQFEDNLTRQLVDPLSALLAVLRRDQAVGLSPSVEITIRPAGHRLGRRAHRCLHRLAYPFFRSHPQLARIFARLALSPHFLIRLVGLLSTLWLPHGAPAAPITVSGTRLHDREDDLQAASDKLGRLLFECDVQLSITGPIASEKRARQALGEMVAAFGQFSVPRLATFHAGPIRLATKRRSPPRPPPFLLSAEELATIFHPATVSVRSPELALVESRELPPPTRLPHPASDNGLAILGLATFRGVGQRFGILPDDRRRHIAILGKTGVGKTTLLHHLLASDIRAGRGVGLIDPHGDLAEAVLASVPRQRTNDVVVFDAGDVSHPLSFNVLDCPTPSARPLVASGVVSAFRKLHREFWGPRLEHILRNAVLALLEVPDTTLLSLLRLLSEAKFRSDIAARVSDPVVRHFWQREFAAMHEKLQVEAIAPIQNKVGHFVSSPILRNIIGQRRNALPLRRLLDEGKVLIVNLSKGRIGDDASALLGSFLVTSLQLAAMSRAELPEARRRDFFLYVDEFQNFATESFATILSEARKYRLSLTLANQYLAQVEDSALHALFGNVGTLVSFQVGVKDAELLSEQLGGDLTIQDLLRLPRYHAYVRLLTEGMPSRPFSMETLPPPEFPEAAARPAVIRRASRHRYARRVAEVEAEIAQAFAR